jgi:hypothetical protein
MTTSDLSKIIILIASVAILAGRYYLHAKCERASFTKPSPRPGPPET